MGRYAGGTTAIDQNEIIAMWKENFYTDHDDLEYIKPVTDIEGLLERIEKFGDPGDAPQKLKDAAQMYLIATRGIDVTGYQVRLPDSFPHREHFQPIKSALAFCDESVEFFRLEEKAMAVAKEILQREYTDLCPLEMLTEAETYQQSFRWPENDDFRDYGRNQGIKF